MDNENVEVTETCSSTTNQNQRFNKTRNKRSDGARANRNEFDIINEKLRAIHPPLIDLNPNQYEKKFLGRYRLYVSNISNSATKDDLENTFKTFGEVNDVFIQPNKNFGFVRMDYHHNALRAKKELHGTLLKDRKIYITFSPQASIVVKHLSPSVSNELLHLAFSIFGEVECCFIVTDKRGKSAGEGVVDFVKKNSALAAKKHCTDKVFFLTSCLKPVTVEDYVSPPDSDGIPEETIRKSREFYEEREMGPRFAIPGSFQYQYAERFKDLWSRYSLKMDMLKSEQESEEQKLELDMRRAQYDYETERLKEMIRQREIEKDRFCKKMDDQVRQTSRDSHLMDEASKVEFKSPDLFMQATQLNEILDTEERNIQFCQRQKLLIQFLRTCLMFVNVFGVALAKDETEGNHHLFRRCRRYVGTSSNSSGQWTTKSLRYCGEFCYSLSKLCCHEVYNYSSCAPLRTSVSPEEVKLINFTVLKFSTQVVNTST